MREMRRLLFAPFRLDLGAEQLWCGTEARPLTRKAFTALRYLAEHAGQLVSKDELIAAVWDAPYVSDMALAACLREMRRALDEQAQAPRFVETVRGRGYRFIAPVTVETGDGAEVGADVGRGVERHAACRPTPPHNLPTSPTVFIGRDAEVAELQHLLLEEPDCRLLTLVGPGGSGKTRLALQVAETIRATHAEHGAFAQGIFFVPLEAVQDASGLVTALLAVLADTSGGASPAAPSLQGRLLDVVRSRALLLVLDNVEHLAGGADVLAALLAAAPGVKILATSRCALNVQYEWFHPLTGMAYPRVGEAPDRALVAYDAVRLFAHYARRARNDFAPAVEAEQVVLLCQLVDGLPLALEIAAAWLKVLSCCQVVGELRRGLDILTARQQDIPARHRSMRTVLEQSWQLLAPEEQDVLSRLAVFQGGFTLDAAQAVAHASLEVLTRLVETAMLHVPTPGRYHLHALLRQFAAEHCQEGPATRAAHSRYFVAFAQERYTWFLEHRYPEAIRDLTADRENLQVAWQWLMAPLGTASQCACALAPLEALLHPLAWLYRERALHWDGQAVFGAACTTILAWLQRGGGSEAHRRQMRVLLARLQIRLAYFCYFLGDYAQVDQLLAAALPLVRAAGLVVEEALALETAARVHLRRGDHQAARAAAQWGLELARHAGQALQATDALVLLARTAADQGDYDLAIRLHQDTVEGYRQWHYTAGTTRALTNLGNTYILRGDYAVAYPLLAQAHAMAREHDNRFLVMFTGLNLGTALLELGSYAEATAYFRQSLALARDSGDQRRLAMNLNFLSLVALHTQDLASAQQHAQHALVVAHSIRCLPEVLRSIACVAHVWARQGHAAPALRALLYVDRHPATLARDKHRSAPLLAAWRETLAPALLSEATAWSATHVLDEVVAWVNATALTIQPPGSGTACASLLHHGSPER